jgi:hypothetical protein
MNDLLKLATYINRFKARFGNPTDDGTKPAAPEGHGDSWFDSLTNILSLPDSAGTSWVDYDLDNIGTGAVTTVFGRTGAVVATTSDYDASQVDNDSSVVGATVKDALDTVADSIALNKTDATVAPATSNDNTEGYSVSSIWVNVTANTAYVCVDATTASAVWDEIGAGGGGGGSGDTTRCRITGVSPSSFLNIVTYTALEFNTDDYDPEDLHDTVTDKQDIVVDVAGTYRLDWQVRGDAGATGNENTLFLQAFINDVADISTEQYTTFYSKNGTNDQIYSGQMWLGSLSINDTVEIRGHVYSTQYVAMHEVILALVQIS